MLALSTPVLNSIERCRPAVMAQFDLPSGSQGIWNWNYDVVYNSVTFVKGVGAIALGEIPGTVAFDSQRVSLKLGALNAAGLAIVNDSQWHQAPVTIYRAFVDTDDVVVDVMTLYAGFLDTAPISDAAGDAFIIDMNVENTNRELSRVNGRVRSDSDQRTITGASNDGFFKYTTAAVSTQINWGRKGPKHP